MTTSDWIALGVVIFAIVVLILTVKVYPKSWCEYWREGWKGVKLEWKLGWNDGGILPVLKVFFLFLSCLSFGVIVSYCIERRYGQKYRYWFVDSYVILWTILIVVFTYFVINDNSYLAPNCGILGVFSYRLFETFQSWVSQYVLGGVPRPWKSGNIYRSLVLVFVGYLQVIFLYALLALILQNNFKDINDWLTSVSYSLGNAVTIGSGIVPTTYIGYALFTTQIMFTLLFLTTAINRIYAAVKQTKS